MKHSLIFQFVIPQILATLSVGNLSAADWTTEIVDRSGAGIFTSLKADAMGNLHMAYVIDDGNHYPLKYAFRDRSLNRWFVMSVAKAASFCSLALDSRGHPHISYVDFGTGIGSKVRYARWDGAAWIVQPIPVNAEVVGYYTSIVIDQEDHPRISFYELAGPRDSDMKRRLRVVSWNGQQWQLQTVDGRDGSGKFNSMAIDTRGVVHLAYANVTSETQALFYAFWDGKWTLEPVDGRTRIEDPAVGYSCAITVDTADVPHITYVDQNRSLVKYAVRKKNGKWESQAIDRVSRIGYPDRNSIAVDDRGIPYIGYHDAGRGTLTVAHREDAGWVADVVDTNSTGYTSSLQIRDGVAWISYTDQMLQAVKAAHADIRTQEKSAASADGARKARSAGEASHR